ncbi:basic proline-rich protein-like [Lynx canadensis]|uniref:basic proline-rich protein-like n=1 Tax=Lynx canadensis TaxID=61383 RepID=UPI0011B0D72F|nr:basic proline-rich protein-like [Lynx canadensis]
MEPLPAAPPAPGTSKGYNPERPSPFPSAPPRSRSGRGPSPSRPPANRRGLGLARHPRGAAPLFVERRPGTYFLAGVRVLLPGVRRPLPVLRRRLPPHRTSSRRRRRRVPPPPPPPPHHVSHPGLRHRVKRSWPAWVGAQRPARALRPRDQSAALRPGRDTTPSGPGHRAPQPPHGRPRPFGGPASPTHSEIRTPHAHPVSRRASAKPPPDPSAPSHQRHSNILRV